MRPTTARLLRNLPILLIELITLLLLGYISYGAVNTQYPRFVLAKMEAQAETIRGALDPYLQGAIPIHQFSGYPSLAAGLLASDPDIRAIRILDPHDKLIFERHADAPGALDVTPMRALTQITPARSGVSLRQSDTLYQVSMPLNGRFGLAGTLEITASRSAALRFIHHHFQIIAGSLATLLIAFTLFTLLADHRSSRHANFAKRLKNVMNTAFFISFMLAVVIIVTVVFRIYDHGARIKTQVLAESMAQRIAAPLKLGIALADIDGLNETFRDFKLRDPDISEIALLGADGGALFHSDPSLSGRPYQAPADSYAYQTRLDSRTASSPTLSVVIPNAVVRQAIVEQAKEFIVILVACGLMSWIFLGASSGFRSSFSAPGVASDPDEDVVTRSLSLVKPAYFLIVFTSALPISFLPQLAHDWVATSGVSFASPTLPFTIYYLVFAAALIPAGRYAEHGDLKKMMALGFFAEMIGLMCIVLNQNYLVFVLGRVFSGVGQGIFLIGLNSYTASITPASKRTLGNTIKVNGRNAALVSGAAIGAVLYQYLDYQKLFAVASVISLIGIIYLIRLVPGTGEVHAASGTAPPASSSEPANLLAVAFRALRDREVVLTLLSVGLIGKIAITGVIMFSVPLVLAQREISSRDIGLALMLFYVASIIMTSVAATHVDKTSTSRSTLFLSALIGGIGMLLIGVLGVKDWSWLVQSGPMLAQLRELGALVSLSSHWYLALLIGVILVGISNGLLSAPIMTHIDKTPAARTLGHKATANAYVFLERGGHVIGPMAISILMVSAGGSSLGIAVFGLLSILAGGIFVLVSRTR